MVKQTQEVFDNRILKNVNLLQNLFYSMFAGCFVCIFAMWSLQYSKKKEQPHFENAPSGLNHIAYAFSVLNSIFVLLYAGQSSVLLQELNPKATNNPTAATNKKAFFMTIKLQYN
ncbi:hypothetical protein [Saccharicrinis fermentans]|uniref:Uncharacterized protein n=1 Tax=Saccharicrinis fermentans DSM 9555 = JCM 21142 TaxID=869213 RepID=W7Y6L4_9BACT|nr:hypothetical protein [Saccharicrinis fermentans]GAF03862.1 hypothetical protein JCM21142_72550 [Saccharicrinis fermentans DSM 9555 = JCM 21142]